MTFLVHTSKVILFSSITSQLMTVCSFNSDSKRFNLTMLIVGLNEGFLHKITQMPCIIEDV